MANSNRYSYQMSIPEDKYGMKGYCYFIADKVTDQVISCWAVGSEVHVEKLAADYCDGMNSRENMSQGQKLRGIERA